MAKKTAYDRARFIIAMNGKWENKYSQHKKRLSTEDMLINREIDRLGEI